MHGMLASAQIRGCAQVQHLSLPHAGRSAPGQWQVTWQYLACLLRNGELYEQLGAWEDASVALKEGLQLVTHTLRSSSSLDLLHPACLQAGQILLPLHPIGAHAKQQLAN